uniref:Rok-like winged helix domain-containing protein n=1 Tax=Domibacillus indicus TaxID=1437523 RepID=UPI0018CDB935|nr:hypothetical protein [Domibacillus indicus]
MMFDEKKAIEKRLSQIDSIESKIMEELQAEREELRVRLQDLESGTGKSPEKGRSRRPKRSVEGLRELAVAYLKEQKVPVRAVEIQRFVEQESGRKITNMSAFMRALEPEYKRIRKLGRGLYIYEYGID